jgi:two-component system, chemotaxis family, CheB/CheR fusion protein
MLLGDGLKTPSRKSAPKKVRTTDSARGKQRGAKVTSRKSESPPENNRSEPSASDAPSFPVVAIGASAGGLEAYTEFFHALPVDTGMAFVLVQHLDPSHHSMLPQILAKATSMPVQEVKPKIRIQPNCVYVIPAGTSMSIADGLLMLTARRKGAAPHLPINIFMRSLAEERKSAAIGVILSGTGADGTSGMEEIKAEGGVTFVQEPGTAKYDGMPRNAIDSGCIDFVLRPSEIATEIARIQHHPYLAAQEEARVEQGKELSDSVTSTSRSQKDFAVVLDQLRKSSGVDFTQYRPNTIYRRAMRRMMILKHESLNEYANHLKGNPDEGSRLFDDVLIPVTSFFRDLEAFESLKEKVYPAIVKDKANKGTIRMWAPGCSTGEETYSLAMTLLEFLGDKAPSFQVQIFGTDLNEKGIHKARMGIYRASIADEISPERLARFFVKVDEGFRINKAVRDMCVFARQNLAADPPFSQMNLVACRNLLIYIQPVLQKKIVPILHYALKPSGFLILGGSESVAAFPELFTTIDKKHKIYGKKAIASRLHYDFVQSYYPEYLGNKKPQTSAKGAKLPSSAAAGSSNAELDLQAEADRLVLKHHAPVGVVIDSASDVVQFRGRTTPYLEQSSGRPSLNLLKMAQSGLAVELRTLIALAKKRDAPVRKSGIRFGGVGHAQILNVFVTPLGETPAAPETTQTESAAGNRFFLVLFEDVTSSQPPVGSKDTALRNGKQTVSARKDTQEEKRLEREVIDTRNALRSAIESEDALKEEFQSASEEIPSANEELQSTNEELETSKEELQSTNEELNTLNAELRHKNNELHDLSNDMVNLLNSTRIPVVMLDRGLRIRRLTPSADKLFKIRSSDVGRPLADIRPNIEVPDLEGMVARVLETLQPEEREVRDLQGHWHSLNILPYRTQDNKIDGAVLALQDIDVLKSTGEQAKRSAEFFRSVLATVPGPLLVLDRELRIVSSNEPFLNTFQVAEEETVHRFLYDLGNGQWNIPQLRELLQQVVSEGKPILDLEIEHEFETIGLKTMMLNGSIIALPNAAEPMLLLAVDDITERKEAEKQLLLSSRQFRALADNMSPLAWTCEQLGEVTWYNQRWLEYTGMTLEEMAGWDWSKVQHPDHLDRVVAGVKQSRESGEIWEDTFPLRRKDGVYRWFLSRAVPIRDADGNVVQWFGTNTDVSDSKSAEAALIKSEKLAVAGRLAAVLAHEINNPLQAVTNLMMILEQTKGLEDSTRTFVKMAGDELGRVTHLTRQSLGFYRESLLPTSVNVQEQLDSVLDIYSTQFEKRGITVRRRYRSSMPITSYPGEIRQIVTTLLVNAMEATPKGGTIVAHLRQARKRINSKPYGVRIVVADTGSGISKENLSHIFEPFFTTKGHQGTGLGLWVAQGIVTRLGGVIDVRSSVRPQRSGTCFSISSPPSCRRTNRAGFSSTSLQLPSPRCQELCSACVTPGSSS